MSTTVAPQVAPATPAAAAPKVGLPVWEPARLGEALHALARAAGLTPAQAEAPGNPPAHLFQDPDSLGDWIVRVAQRAGLEAQAIASRYPDFIPRLASLSPALLRLPGGDFIALLDGQRVLAPDGRIRKVRPEALRSAVFAEDEAPVAATVERFLEEAGIAEGKRRERARTAVLQDLLGAAFTAQCWELRISPGSGWRSLSWHARLPQRLALLGIAHIAQYLLWILSWWLVGKGVLEGRVDPGWLLAWGLLLITLVPLRALATWLQGLIAITAGGLLKERLLAGALRMHPDEVRHQGIGQLLGRVLESEAMESLALSGGFLALVAALELLIAAWVAGQGAGGSLHVLLLAGAFLLVLAGAWRFFRKTRTWAGARITMTQDLVERMVGHRTRLVQQAPELWHEGEDQALESYLECSHRMDRAAARLMALAPRGWLIVGTLALAPAFISGASPALLAIGIGANLLGYRAFRRLAAGLWNLVGAGVAWQQVSPLFHAAAQELDQGSPAAPVARASGSTSPGAPLLEAHGVIYRYEGRSSAVLQDLHLTILDGDRLLLEGPSGGGKSTLAAIVTGLRQPQAGLLLASGLDRHAHGTAGWRRLVAFAPQFHENHVLTGTLAFNALMGRQRLVTQRDVAEAEQVCRELGLGPLLDRMPSGVMQMVGEMGWQLSHGERSRLYIARALLQGADLIILDESFGALDPENLRKAAETVHRRARAILAIAHP
jgi:ATP-binding cassette, subfamily B, bacterial